MGPVWERRSVGRALLRGVAWGLATQPVPWLRWWIAAPHHQSLRGQWYECLNAFVVITLAMATMGILRLRKHGKPRKGGIGQGAA